MARNIESWWVFWDHDNHFWSVSREMNHNVTTRLLLKRSESKNQKAKYVLRKESSRAKVESRRLTNWLRVLRRFESLGQRLRVFESLGALLHLHLLLAAAALRRQSEQGGVCVCRWAGPGGRGRGRTRADGLRGPRLLFQVLVNGVPLLAAERIFWRPPQHQLHAGVAPGGENTTTTQQRWHAGRMQPSWWHREEDVHRLSNSVRQDVADSTLEAFLQTVGDHQHRSPGGGLNV